MSCERPVMNVIRLMGGLGNQFFQYAFGQAMKNKGIEVRYDISKFARRTHRFYMLDKFRMDLEFSSFLLQKTEMDTIGKPSFYSDYTSMTERNFFGYWQYLAYFSKILPQLREDTLIKEEFYTKDFVDMKKRITDDESISVHVRRTDYLYSNTIRCLPITYYYDAFSNVKGNLYFFSDDISWCKKNFKQEYFDRKVIFVQMDYHYDFELMRFCKHNIIANSTFSWWAALMNDNEGKIVVTPDFWITGYDPVKRNNFPKDWIRLKL